MRKVIIFDFDGVIVDTLDIVFEGHRSRNPDMTKEQMVSYFEGNIHFLKDIPHNIALDDHSFALYGPRLMEIPVYPGFYDVLKKLSKDFILVVVSSSREDWVEKYLEKYDLSTCFDVVWGLNNHKSKVEKLKNVLKKYQVVPDECLFVTDTLGDIVEGNKVGIKSVGVDWGYHSVSTLKKGSPLKILSCPEELLMIVE